MSAAALRTYSRLQRLTARVTSTRPLSSTAWIPPELPILENRLDSKDDEITKYELSCNVRPWSKDGSRYSRTYRSQGLIPGIIYGAPSPTSPEPSRILTLTSHQKIQRELVINKLPGYSAFSSRVYDLTLLDSTPSTNAGDVIQVIPRDLQMHPVRNEVLCLNYLRYYPGRPLEIPLRYSMVDDSPALKRGAFILAQNRFVTLTVLPGFKIPNFVEVDCSGLKLKDKVRLDRLALPEGCEWGKDVDDEFLVGSVFGRAKTMAGVEEEE
ncbi:hypothetical protein TrVE_jg4941 [Triparma verrucosa]|uniref:Ribosomal protein L25 n=1 Tax=Triparma verrucosa TaxID=1606542 RepID=A0A9W7FFY2_9STRA|nr:hypothetical protein TrVE_jg4941 [Triparma verrucosa]